MLPLLLLIRNLIMRTAGGASFFLSLRDWETEIKKKKKKEETTLMLLALERSPLDWLDAMELFRWETRWGIKRREEKGGCGYHQAATNTPVYKCVLPLALPCRRAKGRNQVSFPFLSLPIRIRISRFIMKYSFLFLTCCFIDLKQLIEWEGRWWLINCWFFSLISFFTRKWVGWSNSRSKENSGRLSDDATSIPVARWAIHPSAHRLSLFSY